MAASILFFQETLSDSNRMRTNFNKLIGLDILHRQFKTHFSRRANLCCIVLARRAYIGKLLGLYCIYRYIVFPAVFADYLASGLPIVLNYRGWQARILAEHRCGLSADQGDTDGFQQAIRRLAGDAELRREMGRNARGVAETVLNRENVVAPILEGLAAL